MFGRLLATPLVLLPTPLSYLQPFFCLRETIPTSKIQRTGCWPAQGRWGYEFRRNTQHRVQSTHQGQTIHEGSASTCRAFLEKVQWHRDWWCSRSKNCQSKWLWQSLSSLQCFRRKWTRSRQLRARHPSTAFGDTWNVYQAVWWAMLRV